MTDIIDNLSLSYTARFVMLWIEKHPSDVINPDAIAEASLMPVKLVKVAFKELADADYLNAPQRVNDPVKAGRFTWTPYTLNPSYGQPSHGKPEDGNETNGETPVRAESPSTENPPMDTGSNGNSDAFEYVSVAGEKDLSKSSLVLSSQTEQDLVAQQDQDAPPVNVVPTTYAEALADASPQVQAQADDLIAKAQPPTDDDQNAPDPGSGEPLSPDESAAEAYWSKQLPKSNLSGGYKARLRAAVNRFGLVAIKAAIEAAKAEGSRIHSPMAWMERRLEGQEAEGKLPGKNKPLVARSHQNALPPSNPNPDPRDYFEWLNDKKIGAPA